MAIASTLDDRVRLSADPSRAQRVLARLPEIRPDAFDRLDHDEDLAASVVAVAAGSGWLGRLLVADADALDVLADLERPQTLDADDADALARWRRLEHLRIAARDLTGRDPLEGTMALVTAMAAAVLGRALELAGAVELAVIAVGKAGGNELNYASDVDVLLVGTSGSGAQQGAARRALDAARVALRIDVDLRPEGRDGALVRTVAGYRAHWERWAEPWERQALIKARPLAGDAEVAAAFVAAASAELWERGFDADAIHQVRAMKARTERVATGERDGARDIKRTPGGLRDVEFSVQLLQLVHGPLDPSLRVRGTLPALTTLADGGYVEATDASWLRASYRFLRRIEHGVQLDEDRQTHAVPVDRADRARLARVLGLVDRPSTAAVDELDRELRACRATVRSIHERIYFRPLLDAFSRVDAPLADDAVVTRLAAFGFADAERTRQATSELTRGVNRASRLMAQTLPLLLDWLSSSPDPDRGLLSLRTLVAAEAGAVAAACRESPETARRLCLLAGTSPSLVRDLAHAPDLLGHLHQPLDAGGRPDESVAAIARSAEGDHTVAVRQASLRRAVGREQLRIAAADVLDGSGPVVVGPALATVARAAVEAAVALADPQVPFAVLALGRLAGGELGYASDLDLLLAHDADDEDGRVEAMRAAEVVRRALRGTGPADRIYDVDLDLRPGGRGSPVVASRAAIESHLERWAAPWERLALSRLQPIAGDPRLGQSVVDAVAPAVWRPLDEGARRAIRRVKARMEAERIPAGEDPAFHLKLGPGALADVELTVGLLLLEHAIREPGTTDGIAALRRAGRVAEDDAEDLAAAHAFCARTRDRWTLVAGRPRDSLPSGQELTTLARSLGTTAPGLRDRYQRLTRRSRRVVERLFYCQPV